MAEEAQNLATVGIVGRYKNIDEDAIDDEEEREENQNFLAD